MWLSVYFWKTGRVAAEWAPSDHGCSKSGHQWLSPALCVGPTLHCKPPSPALIPVAKPKFIGPLPNVYPKYSSFTFRWVHPTLHGCCHAFTPGRVASIANSKALLLGGNSGGVVRNNIKQHITKGDIGPTLVVAFITKKISFSCVEEGWDENLKHKKADLLLWSKISYLVIAAKLCQIVWVYFQLWTNHKKPSRNSGQTHP